jgi:hypothetical protein
MVSVYDELMQYEDYGNTGCQVFKRGIHQKNVNDKKWALKFVFIKEKKSERFR